MFYIESDNKIPENRSIRSRVYFTASIKLLLIGKHRHHDGIDSPANSRHSGNAKIMSRIAVFLKSLCNTTIMAEASALSSDDVKTWMPKNHCNEQTH